MKLSAQLASILPLSPNSGTTAVRGPGAFAPAMEELIARLSSEAPVLQRAPEGQLKVPTRTHIATPHVTVLESAGETLPKTKLPAVDPKTDVPVPHKAEESTVVAQGGLQEPVPAAKYLNHNLPVSPVQGPAVQEANVREPSAELPEDRSIAETGKPPREQHKTDKIKLGDARNIATPALPDPAVPLLQILPQSITVIAAPPGKLVPEAGVSKGSVEPANGRVHTGNKRRPVVAAGLPVPGNPVVLTSLNKQFARAIQNPPQPEETAVPPKEHPSVPANETLLTGAPARPSEDVSSAMMVHRSEAHEVTGASSDLHPTKESQKETLTVAQVIPAEKASVHPSPAEPVIQPQAAANTAAPAVAAHRAPQPVEAHRLEANATQVLQRMDAASPSSGAVQLRADARHLDVGVSSASLGWIEVRASVNPSGKVDAALHLETNISAHLVAAQSKEIADYAREHSVQLGQISVGVGTGDASRGSSGSMHEQTRSNHTVPLRTTVKDAISGETRESTDKVSLISIRA